MQGIKKILIIASAIYLILIGIILDLLLILPPTFKHPPPVILIISVIIFALWVQVTAVGILYKKNWARESLITLSAVTIFLASFLTLRSLYVPSVLPFKVPPSIKTALFSFVIPGFFLFFFTRNSIKGMFAFGNKPKHCYRPVGVLIIVIFSIFCGVGSLLVSIHPSFLKSPLIGNVLISGIWLRLYYFILGLLDFYIAVGLWKMNRSICMFTIYFNVFMLLVGLFNYVTLTDANIDIILKTYVGKHPISLEHYKSYYKFDLINLITTYYLFIKRKIFV